MERNGMEWNGMEWNDTRDYDICVDERENGLQMDGYG
jgi:hypothetical protein